MRENELGKEAGGTGSAKYETEEQHGNIFQEEDVEDADF